MIRRIDKYVRTLALGMGWVSGTLFFALACFIFVDVVSRKLFGVTTGGTVEISAMVEAVAVSGTFAYCFFMDDHITIDTLSARYSVSLQRMLRVITFVVFAILAAVFAFSSWRLAFVSWETNAKTSIVGLPLVYSQAYMAFALSVLSLGAVVRTIHNLIYGAEREPEVEGAGE